MGFEPELGLEQLRGTLDSIQEGIQILDAEYRYLYVNEAVCRHGKKSRAELVGKPMTAVYPGIEQTEMFAALKACMETRQSREMVNEFVYPDGTRSWFELRIRPCPEGIFVLSVDVTARRNLEAQFRQAQKLDALGKLAGGVAHDFNNVLTAIKSFAQFALEGVAAASPVAADLAEVLAAADRAGGLTRQLLAFARHQPNQPQATDVNAVVASMDKLLRRLLAADIDIASHLAPGLWETLIDPGALEQVLVNLAVNARDAMPRGGKLTLETRNQTLQEAQVVRHGGVLEPGDYVVLAVSDDGIGMDAQLQERIFEPFFTTKEVGKGTGLGLATCYGIVRQAGGQIWVYSEPGHGSTFKVFLPRARAQPASTGAAVARTPLTSPAGRERVLLVEDDVQVRELAARALRQLGYQVLAAANSGEAQALFESAAEPVDLLVTDVVMPGMDGYELARRLTERRPALRTLFVSGYTEAAMLHRGVRPQGSLTLDKPFTPSLLAQRVREVLEGR